MPLLLLILLQGAITPLPSDEQKACQSPKPILLNTVRCLIQDFHCHTSKWSSQLLCQGFAHTPYEWSPSTVDVQMLRVGNFGKRLSDAGFSPGPFFWNG